MPYYPDIYGPGAYLHPDDNQPPRDEWWKVVLWIAMGFCILILLCGCKTHERVIETIRTDTTYITKHQRDSIYVHDSISVKEDGDTVWMEKWHTKYIERLLHDTTYVARHDTLTQSIIKEVRKPLTRWQNFRLTLGTLSLGAILLAAVWGGFKLYRRIT